MATYRSRQPDPLIEVLVDAAIGFVIGAVAAVILALLTLWWLMG